MKTEILLSPAPSPQPAVLFTPTPKAAQRVLKFFTAQINNDHTRRAHLNATRPFSQSCGARYRRSPTCRPSTSQPSSRISRASFRRPL